ncbi:DUF3618 domain-containing protein [Azotobacter vinelandii]|uniref:DUF3618 domain-containing protein n=1 Tax=Azotobacter vinelandii TaxID=354 RepID=UPI00266644A0|nr:DUF3618 domain-containing protein [Azotobacter vinelandii]WKN20478.1 DUF3618 domain-containing protein [Azotobacter vinelandii]
MSTQSRIDLEAQKGPETLEQEIDRQRAEISNIVHALENRLSPGELLDRALGYTKGHGGEFMSNLTNTVAANPLPTVLTSIGLLWLMTSQNRAPASQAHVDEASTPQSGPSLTEKARQRAAGIREKAGHLGEGMSDTLGSARQHVSESVGSARQYLSDSGHHAAESLRQRAHQARGGFDTLMHEQPLVLGALGIAVGALIAGVLPTTRQEDELLGQASDTLTDKLRVKAEEGREAATELGVEMADRLRERVATSQPAGAENRTGLGGAL